MKNMSSVSVIVYSNSLKNKNNIEHIFDMAKSAIKVMEFKIFKLHI
jgi:hypothetical protein